MKNKWPHINKAERIFGEVTLQDIPISHKMFEPNDTVIFTSLDTRWWLRFWRWITFRTPPMIEETHIVDKRTDDGFTIKES